MIVKCNNGKKIENYIKDDLAKCIYIYLDYKQYGVENKDVCFYEQHDRSNNTTCIMLYYYNSGFHIYSRDKNCEYNELANFIMELKPASIFAESEIIKKLEELIKNSHYISEYGRIWKAQSFKTVDRKNIKEAEENDFDEIANLLMQDEDIKCSYSFEGLKRQLIERNRNGISRNYVIKENGKVIAHTATGVETKDIAVSALNIVDVNHRRKGLATLLLNAAFEDLIKEGKSIYFVNYTEESSALYNKLGCKVCCEWGKLFLNK